MGHSNGLPPINIDLRCTLQDIVPGGTVNVNWTIPTLKTNEEASLLNFIITVQHFYKNSTISLGNITLAKEGNTSLILNDFPEDPSGSPMIIATANKNSYYGCCSRDPAYDNSECMFKPQSRTSENSPGSSSNTQSSSSSSFPMTSPLSSTSNNTGISKGTIAGIVIAIIFILLAALLIASLCYKTRRKRRLSQAPLLIPFNASSRTPQTAPVIPPQQWVTFNMHDNELPEYPASVVGTNTSMREDKPVMLDQRAQKDGWYQGETTERMQQLDEERQQMKDLIEQFRERGEREWGISADALRPATRGIPYLR